MIFKQPRNVRARKMWERPAFYVRPDFALSKIRRGIKGERPVFVLPADDESYERMREQVAQGAFYTTGIRLENHYQTNREVLLKRAGEILSALGIHPPRKSGKK